MSPIRPLTEEIGIYEINSIESLFSDNHHFYSQIERKNHYFCKES